MEAESPSSADSNDDGDGDHDEECNARNAVYIKEQSLNLQNEQSHGLMQVINGLSVNQSLYLRFKRSEQDQVHCVFEGVSI